MESDSASLPAAAVVAAPKSAERMQKLMMGIGFPLRWLPSASDDDTGAIQRAALAGRNSRGEVHEARDWAQHARAMMNETDELPHVGLPTKIEHSMQSGMRIGGRADLYE